MDSVNYRCTFAVVLDATYKAMMFSSAFEYLVRTHSVLYVPSWTSAFEGNIILSVYLFIYMGVLRVLLSIEYLILKYA